MIIGVRSALQEGRNVEAKLLLLIDEGGQEWMVNLAHVVAFAPVDDFKCTVLKLLTGATLKAQQPISYFIPNYPIPTKTGIVDPSGAEVIKVPDASAV